MVNGRWIMEVHPLSILLRFTRREGWFCFEVFLFTLMGLHLSHIGNQQNYWSHLEEMELEL
jgi:hypothetical protein